MKNLSIKLYSLGAPLFALPLLDFGFDQIVPYLKGPEFRAIFAELLTQVVAGVVDTFILVAVQNFFGA
jgi:hypothetical protein